ncbi:hypothetical protein HUJ04_005628 [Dendroctonus ponderosae]|nr:hypothetical protein HUJ04_005628 [Dendroctonus ponderosae]KAH1004620.1 hypothetical protein HUJ05_005412 [Dendroctonus ponderosae]
MEQEDTELVLPKIGKQLGKYRIGVLRKSFQAYGTTFQNVAFCARITSVERKNDRTRLILDDGTSAILCVLNHSNSIASNSEEEEDEVLPAEDEPSRLGQLLEAQSRRLMAQRDPIFSRISLGNPVFVVGGLHAFEGKHFVLVSSVRRVTEDYFVQFLNFAVRGAEFRKYNINERPS